MASRSTDPIKRVHENRHKRIVVERDLLFVVVGWYNRWFKPIVVVVSTATIHSTMERRHGDDHHPNVVLDPTIHLVARHLTCFVSKESDARMMNDDL
jgi:hypothetical protein